MYSQKANLYDIACIPETTTPIANFTISQWKIVRFWQRLVHYSRYWTPWQSRDQKLEFLIFKMTAAAILKIAIFCHNSSTDCPISATFCMRKQNGRSTRATWQNQQIFRIQDGGLPPFWKSLNRHISVKNRPILMKFGTLHQILNPITWPKIEIFKIEDGGGRHLENRLLGHNSSTDCPISSKFCM